MYPLELHCDVQAREVKQEDTNLNVDEKEFQPRSNAAALANARKRDNNIFNQGYKNRRFPGKKIQQKGNFLLQKHSLVKKKHSKEEIFTKETFPLPLLGGNLPEIVSLHQLRHIHLLV